MSPSRFDLVLDAGAELGESPVWSVAHQALVFVDISGRRLHRFDPVAGAHRVDSLPEDIGCVTPTRDGGFAAGLRSGVWLLDGQARPVRKLADNPEDTAWSRFNDARVDPAGRWLLGTIDEQKQGRASLYRLDGRGLVRLAGGLMTSNGLAFSPDGRFVYHADTPRFVVRRYRYDLAAGSLGEAEVFIQLDPQGRDRGRPDGAAVDADGCYWTALFEGGRVQRYGPDGRLMSEHPVPARRPTMPAFGGADLKTLYVTTARDPDGSGGGLYALDAGVAGLPATPFDAAPVEYDR